MQSSTARAIFDELNRLIESVRNNDTSALRGLLDQYIPLAISEHQQLPDGNECLRIFQQNLIHLEQLRTCVAPHSGEQNTEQFFLQFILPFVGIVKQIPKQQQQQQQQQLQHNHKDPPEQKQIQNETDFLSRSVRAVNDALSQNDPNNTLTVLRPFLREHTLKALHVHRIQGSLGLIAGLYHVELVAAKTDKGSDLTQEELIAASDVLSCVVRLNEAIDRHDPQAVYFALIASDAYWDDVHMESDIREQDKWARFYFQRLCRVRDQKSISGRLPILTHAEIQAVISQYRNARLSSHETGRIRGTSSCGSCSPLCDTPEKSSVDRCMDRLLSSLTHNIPLLTFESLRAMQRSGLLADCSLTPAAADLYHSFIQFYLHHCQNQVVCSQQTFGVSKPNSLSIDHVCEAVDRTRRLENRMRELGLLLTELNQAVELKNPVEISRCLRNSLIYTDLGSTNIQWMNGHANPAYNEAYESALIQLRANRIARFQCSGNRTSTQSTEQPRLSLTAAYLETLCSFVLDCGWLWTHIPAVSSHEAQASGTIEDQILTRFRVPYFYNIYTRDIIRWPIHTSVCPAQTCVWTDNLSQLRWPTGIRDVPCLDPAVLNREDCLLVVSRVNKLMELQNSIQMDPVPVLPVLNWSELCQATATLVEAHLPPEQYMVRKHHHQQQLACLVRCIVRIQSYWRGYCARKQFRNRLEFYDSPTVQKAVVCLQKHWRRRSVQQRLAQLRLDQRKRIFDLIRLQSLWRGTRARLFLRRLYSLARYTTDTAQNYAPIEIMRVPKRTPLVRKTAPIFRTLLWSSSSEPEREIKSSNDLTETRKKTPVRLIVRSPSTHNFTPPGTCQSDIWAVDCVAQYVHCLDGCAAKAAYRQELEGFSLGKKILTIINRLDEVQKELTSSDKLIKLLIQIRLNGRTVSTRSDPSSQQPVPEFNGELEFQTTGCHNASDLSTVPSPLIRLYGQVCYLCYTQPEYVANLVCAIPNAMLWKFSVIPQTSGFCHFRPNMYGLSIERLVFGLFRYASTTADELRLMHVLIRCVHKEIYQLYASGDTHRWFAEHEPWPFVFRLAVSMARLKTNQQHTHKSSAGRNQSGHSLSVNGAATIVPGGAKGEGHGGSAGTEFQTHVTRLRMLLVDVVEQIKRTDRERSNGSEPARSNWSNKRAGVMSPWLSRTKSALAVHIPSDSTWKSKSQSPGLLSTESAPILETATPLIGKSESALQHMIEAAAKFFHGIFVQPGLAALPECLVQIMRELYLALRHMFPDHPEKIHLKLRFCLVYIRFVLIRDSLHNQAND
ncbi:unnamed protein product [Echinostoma caproni]|uniref:AAA domain-containing protein n=1 Tax=Echinostoma caproni TaxID=27848 RepID=A0A183AU01_9TREM|nr:unnamed protein product [Echinostoma caproni]